MAKPVATKRKIQKLEPVVLSLTEKDTLEALARLEKGIQESDLYDHVRQQELWKTYQYVAQDLTLPELQLLNEGWSSHNLEEGPAKLLTATTRIRANFPRRSPYVSH